MDFKFEKGYQNEYWDSTKGKVKVQNLITKPQSLKKIKSLLAATFEESICKYFEGKRVSLESEPE